MNTTNTKINVIPSDSWNQISHNVLPASQSIVYLQGTLSVFVILYLRLFLSLKIQFRPFVNMPWTQELSFETCHKTLNWWHCIANSKLTQKNLYLGFIQKHITIDNFYLEVWLFFSFYVTWHLDNNEQRLQRVACKTKMPWDFAISVAFSCLEIEN